MVALMLLYGLAQFVLLQASPYEAVVLGVFQGGSAAIVLLACDVFWRGIRSVT
jgi:hypothetical protein